MNPSSTTHFEMNLLAHIFDRGCCGMIGVWTGRLINTRDASDMVATALCNDHGHCPWHCPLFLEAKVIGRQYGSTDLQGINPLFLCLQDRGVCQSKTAIGESAQFNKVRLAPAILVVWAFCFWWWRQMLSRSACIPQSMGSHVVASEVELHCSSDGTLRLEMGPLPTFDWLTDWYNILSPPIAPVNSFAEWFEPCVHKAGRQASQGSSKLAQPFVCISNAPQLGNTSFCSRHYLGSQKQGTQKHNCCRWIQLVFEQHHQNYRRTPLFRQSTEFFSSFFWCMNTSWSVWFQV